MSSDYRIGDAPLHQKGYGNALKSKGSAKTTSPLLLQFQQRTRRSRRFQSTRARPSSKRGSTSTCVILHPIAPPLSRIVASETRGQRFGGYSMFLIHTHGHGRGPRSSPPHPRWSANSHVGQNDTRLPGGRNRPLVRTGKSQRGLPTS